MHNTHIAKVCDDDDFPQNFVFQVSKFVCDVPVNLSKLVLIIIDDVRENIGIKMLLLLCV